ncbi:polysaccharide biosynthesis tyrosine autokinase [Pseudonocardia sp. TRM90224]|uniref:polysaccharide biosynthesis tyrosine autokinase n=1 Tax=Pseudonocardia sp. TRM90224 TaxID=2812678 RepID=UPI001E5485E7|nr:polysaccharide biosynthesis tyrosine autokinase [Pseudonocardia sp. TRM90224]
MSFRAYLRLLRDGRWWISAGLLIGLAAGFLSAQTTDPVYSASTTLYVAAIEGGGEPGQAYQGSLLAEQKSRAYAELMSSERIRAETANVLGEPIDPGVISGQASAGSPVVTVTARTWSPELAARIANIAAGKLANLVSELERPQDRLLSTVITVRVVAEAAEPTDPVAPDLRLSTALGGLIGLLVGVGITLLRRNLDRSVREPAALEGLAGAPLLASLPKQSRRQAGLSPTPDGSTGRNAEAVRMLRTNVRFAAGGREITTLLIASAVPGEGRTSLACELALAYGQQRQRVLLVDADLRTPRVAQRMNIDGSTGLSSVLAGRCEVDDAIFSWAGVVDVLPGGPVPVNPSELLDSERLVNLLDHVKRKYDVVLIDSSPLLPSTDAAILAARCDATLLLVRHGRTADARVEAAAEALRRVRATVIGAVFTMAPGSMAPPKAHRDTPAQAEPVAAAALSRRTEEVTQSITVPSPAPEREVTVPTALDPTPPADPVDTTDRTSTTELPASENGAAAPPRPQPTPRAKTSA